MPGTQLSSRRKKLEPGTHSAFFQSARERVESRTRGDMASTGRAEAIPESVDIWRSPGRAGFDIVPTMRNRRRSTFRTMSNRAPPAAHHPGAPLHSTRQAAGVPSAWSQPFILLPRDRADGATLGSLPPGGDSEGRRPRTPRRGRPGCSSFPHRSRPSPAGTPALQKAQPTLGPDPEATQKAGVPERRRKPWQRRRH
jgi:hypothetical protein